MSQTRRELPNPSLDAAAHLLAPGREASTDFLRTLAEAFRCEWATYWQVDRDLQVLRPALTWNAPHVQAQKLASDTIGRTLSLSEGTAGHVWRSRKPVWTVDLERDMCLPRSLDAGEAGFKGGIWFAVKTNERVHAVVELLARDLPEPSDELLLAIEGYGFRLGTILEG